MKWTAPLLALIVAASFLTPARAQWPPPGCAYSCPVPALPQAPNACGPGYYDVNAYGATFGPNYWLVPPNGPFNGMIFARQAAAYGQGGPGAPPAFPGFPSHPYARSPRDYFMVD